jgi:putative endonuclease
MPNERRYFVYILSSRMRRLYVGVTNDLARRVAQHKRRDIDGFTKRYNIDRLVYYEETSDVRDARERERHIKGRVRARKVTLVQEMNPTWQDLAADWAL